MRRERRKEALANGQMEVLVGRNSRFSAKAEAALVLDQHSLPGRGVKQTLTLATVTMPVSFDLIEELQLGHWAQVEASLDNGVLMSEQQLIYAGRVIKSKNVEASGEFAIQSIVKAVIAEECFAGFAKQRTAEIELWKIYVELGLDEKTKNHNDFTFTAWFEQQLTALGICAYSGAIQPPFPRFPGHPFRFNPDTISGINQPFFH